MYQNLVNYIGSCPLCATRKGPGTRYKDPLLISEPLSAPFERLAVDTMGPFPLCKETNARHIIVFIDYATRFVLAKPIPDITAKTCARVLRDEVLLKSTHPSPFILTMADLL